MSQGSESEPHDELVIAGRYSLLTRLGVGGMGEVWQCHDSLTGETLAIKVLRPSIAGAPAAELRFQREVVAMARLNHPRIVPVIDAGSDPGAGLFFVMALQPGEPLHEVGATWTSWSQVWPIADQILETLSYAHARGVIHRDIKPDNVLVDEAGDIALLDFGVARLKDHARSGTSAYDMLGTVDYAAPEQATGNRRRVGPWTDIYCFAIVIYEIICGRLPFWAPSAVQSLMIRLDHGCPPLEPRPGFETPVGLHAVLDEMMRPEPLDRFHHAAEARAALAALAGTPMEVITPAIDAVEPGWPEEREDALTDDQVGQLLQQRIGRYKEGTDISMSSRPLEAPLRPPSLVGRDRLLLSLSRALDRWRHNPQPGVLLLCGPPGIGKTRVSIELVTPFLAAGQVDGHRHRWRSGPSMRETALSVAGVIGLPEDAARDHLHWWLGGHGLEEPAARQRLIDWAMGHRDVPSSSGLGALRFAEFMRACTRPGMPFVLVIDGLVHLDSEVVDIVQAIRTHRLPIALVGTSRSADVEPGLARPSWLDAAARQLKPLDDAALDKIVEELVELDAAERAPIVYAADGSPARLLEALSELRRRGDIVPAWPRWVRAPEDWEPPDDSHGSLNGPSSMGPID